MVPREAKNHGIPKIVVIARSMLYSIGSFRPIRVALDHPIAAAIN